MMNAEDLALPDIGVSYREQNPEENFDLMRTATQEEQDIIKARLDKAWRERR